LGIVVLLAACGGGGVTSYNQYCAEPGCNPAPPPAPNSRFGWTFVGQGEVTRTTGGCRVRMPKVEIEETNGYGGYLRGSSARIYYTDVAGAWQIKEEYLTGDSFEQQVGLMRYEGKAKRTVELVFEPAIDPRPGGLHGVDWYLTFEDDANRGELNRIEISVPMTRLDLGPGL
jgi:hypothetical protein